MGPRSYRPRVSPLNHQPALLPSAAAGPVSGHRGLFWGLWGVAVQPLRIVPQSSNLMRPGDWTGPSGRQEFFWLSSFHPGLLCNQPEKVPARPDQSQPSSSAGPAWYPGRPGGQASSPGSTCHLGLGTSVGLGTSEESTDNSIGWGLKILG